MNICAIGIGSSLYTIVETSGVQFHAFCGREGGTLAHEITELSTIYGFRPVTPAL